MSPCRLGPMSRVNLKNWPWRPVNFRSGCVVQVRIDVYYMRIDVYYHPSMDIYPSVYIEGDRTGDTCVCKNSLTMEIFHVTCRCIVVRDWSLITRRGGLQNGKIAGRKLFAPPPQDRVNTFCAPPLLKNGNFLRPPPHHYG